MTYDFALLPLLLLPQLSLPPCCCLGPLLCSRLLVGTCTVLPTQPSSASAAAAAVTGPCRPCCDVGAAGCNYGLAPGTWASLSVTTTNLCHLLLQQWLLNYTLIALTAVVLLAAAPLLPAASPTDPQSPPLLTCSGTGHRLTAQAPLLAVASVLLQQWLLQLLLHC